MTRSNDSLAFFCGPDGYVDTTDAHDRAASKHLELMLRHHRARTGEAASLDEQVMWLIEGREASERRATMWGDL